jgi:F-type H+-transporting ATPase subunit epsilon
MSVPMELKILLPFEVFAEESSVLRIVLEAQSGSFGLLPHRLDCVAALNPSILIYETSAKGEVYVAIDEGVLIKTGDHVRVSVRNAVSGKDLQQLKGDVDKNFLILNDREVRMRSVMKSMENDFVKTMIEVQNG